MKNLKEIMFAVALFILAGAAYGWYLYNKKPPDIRKQNADLEVTAWDLLSTFKDDEVAAGKKYIDKIIIVAGKVTDANSGDAGQVTMLLDTGDPLAVIICSFHSSEAAAVTNITVGTEVKVKGVCTGILTDIILNRCILVQ